MAIWDKLKTELDRAGKAAQSVVDEGKVRLEAFRTRQLEGQGCYASALSRNVHIGAVGRALDAHVHQGWGCR